MRRRGGFIMVLALVYVFVLTVIVTAMAYFIAYETRGIGFQLDDTKALYLAQAGAERGFREIRDEVLSPPQSGIADLRGATTSGTAGTATTRGYVRYYNEGNVLTLTSSGTGTYVILNNFDVNYLQTRIRSVKIGCRYRRSATGGTNPSLELLYTTNGVFPQAGNSSKIIVLPNDIVWRTDTSLDISADRAWTWQVINNSNFQIRARGYNSANRNVQIDYLFLQVAYDIDTNTEPWYTGSYAAFPVTLGDGTIKTVTITDEARKVHLNTASQALLRYLMQEHGVPAATANTLATNIVNYRGAALTNPFDSPEELQQVSGMTTAYYNLIKDDITVYSYINTSVQRPTGAPLYRAPVNINTATHEVLSAIFDPIIGTTTSNRLANDIMAARTTAPFTCFYNSNSTTDFYDFVNGRGYLTITQRRQVLDNADASLLVPVAGYGGYSAVTTEFCYANTAYRIESVGSIAVPAGTGTAKYINLRAAEIVGNNGSRTFPVYANQPQAAWKGYWKESYE